MKLNRLGLVALAILFSSLALPSGHAAVITKDYGTGADTTHLLLQFAGAVDSVLYTYHFTYNAGSPLTGAALFIALDGADSSLSLNYDGSASSSFYLKNVSYNGYSEPTSAQLADGSSWTYFDSGGLEQAYDSSFNPIPGTFNSVPSGSWNPANAGASDRYVQPDSWDAWVLGTWGYNPGTDTFEYTGSQPSISPVPEPSSVSLLALGGLALALTLRRRHA